MFNILSLLGLCQVLLYSIKNGILVSVGDRKAMSEAISRVADDKAFADHLSESAVKIKDALSHTKICEKWWALIEK